MRRRNGWRVGEHLVIDEESGVAKYSSEVTKDYTGRLVTREYADYEHPQDFVRAGNDPQPIADINPPDTTFDVCVYPDATIGNTGVANPRQTFSSAFERGIGQAQIDCNFIVK